MPKAYIGEIDTIPQLCPYHRDTGGSTLTVFRIDPQTGLVTITQEYDSGSFSADAWNFIDIERVLEMRPEEEYARRYLLEKIDNLQAIIDGHSIEDGRGYLPTWGHIILSAIVEGLENLPETKWELWTIDDWLSGCSAPPTLLNMTDEEITKLADDVESTAKMEYVVLTGDVLAYYMRMRDEQKAHAEAWDGWDYGGGSDDPRY